MAQRNFIKSEDAASTEGGTTTCPHCGAPNRRWPAAWSIEGYCEDSSLSRAYVYQRIAAGEIEVRKAGSRSLILFGVGWRFLRNLPRYVP